MELTFRKGKGKGIKQKRDRFKTMIWTRKKTKWGHVAGGGGGCFRWGEEGELSKEAKCGPRAERQEQVQRVTSSAGALRPREKSCNTKYLPLIQQRP